MSLFFLEVANLQQAFLSFTVLSIFQKCFLRTDLTQFLMNMAACFVYSFLTVLASEVVLAILLSVFYSFYSESSCAALVSFLSRSLNIKSKEVNIII